MNTVQKTLAIIAAIVLLVVMWIIAFAPTGEAADFDPDNPDTFSVLPPSCTPTIPSRCVVNAEDNSRPIIIAWGDSHLVQQLPAYKQHAINANHALMVYGMGLCPPFKPAASNTDPCAQQARLAMDFIKAKKDSGRRVTVLLGGAWHYYWTTTEGPRAARAAAFRAGEAAMFNYLDNLNVRVATIAQTPTLPVNGDPACTLESEDCSRALMLPDEIAISDWLLARLAPMSGYLSGVTQAYLCDAAVCRVNAGEVPLFFDTMHLNVNYTHLNQASFRWLVQ